MEFDGELGYANNNVFFELFVVDGTGYTFTILPMQEKQRPVWRRTERTPPTAVNKPSLLDTWMSLLLCTRTPAPTVMGLPVKLPDLDCFPSTRQGISLEEVEGCMLHSMVLTSNTPSMSLRGRGPGWCAWTRQSCSWCRIGADHGHGGTSSPKRSFGVSRRVLFH